jgi:uncharacterized protein
MKNMNFKDLKIMISEKDYAIVKSKKTYPEAFANIIDNNENTVIIEDFKLDKKDIIKIERGWKIITFKAILEFDLVGFLAKISTALAKKNISIFAISAYSSDHILIKKEDLNKALKALDRLGIKT